VDFHVRNIDIAKQWPDITRERNLGAPVSVCSALLSYVLLDLHCGLSDIARDR
jgi:hypothetical protein